MPINNKYVTRSKISEAKFREMVRYFSADLDATQISILSGLNRNTVNRYIKALRERIAEHCESEALTSLPGEVEADESVIGVHRVKIWLGNGANGNTAAAQPARQNSIVHTRIVTDDAHSSPKKSVIIGKLSRNRVMYCNRTPGSDEPGNDAEGESARTLNRTKSIEGFWNIAKNRLAKFRGVNKSTFYLHLKECEFRYNYRNENLYLQILKLVRNKPLFQESP